MANSADAFILLAVDAEHECDELLDNCTILLWRDRGWDLRIYYSDLDEEMGTPISFCPFCGVRLGEMRS